MAIWTDEDNIQVNDGEIGFLVKRYNILRGRESYSLQARPAHTNQSHKPRLHGWCGTDNDVATHAEGLACVSRVAGNGRALLKRVDPSPQALESLGYPELD